jgi:preprotein translocase subunit SecA
MAQQLGSLEKVLRFGEGRRVKRLAEQAAYIGTLEPEFEALSDAELAGKTAEFRQRIENGEPIDELVFEAFAAVREAFKRTMGVRLFDVQEMGGIVLHEGDIAEMKTGEGKTFVAVQPLYLNALSGASVHLVTVNDYLAKRDPEWTQPVWEALGMRASFIQNMMPFDERREAYAADVVYGTNSEFGFDYLRDNMAVTLDGVVQRGHDFAIVDEVDSILIDEARTPLIISGEPEVAAQVYYDFARVARGLEGYASRPATRRAPQRPPAQTSNTTRSTRPSRRCRARSTRSSARSGSTTSTTRATPSLPTTSTRRSRRRRSSSATSTTSSRTAR